MDGLYDKDNRYGYINAVSQLMLRLPAVALWLDKHESVENCKRNTCVACLMQQARSTLGKSLVCGLVGRRRLVGERFQEVAPHSPADFAVELVEAFRCCEIARGLVSASQLTESDEEMQVTHIDRLFGFVVELRRRC